MSRKEHELLSGVGSTEKRFQKYRFVITSVWRFESRHTIWNTFLFSERNCLHCRDLFLFFHWHNANSHAFLEWQHLTHAIVSPLLFVASLPTKWNDFVTQSIHCFPGARATPWEIENQRSGSNWHCQRPGCIKWLQTSRRSSHVSYTPHIRYTILFQNSIGGNFWFYFN